MRARKGESPTGGVALTILLLLTGGVCCVSPDRAADSTCMPWDVDADLSSALEGPADPVEAALAFIADPAVRRAALEASVSVSDTAYGAQRLSHYSLRGACVEDDAQDWDGSPVYLPENIRPLRVGESATDRPEPLPSSSLGDLSELSTLDDWVALGREAFFRYPVSVDAGFRALRASDTAEAFGVRVDDDGVAETLVESQMPDGSWAVGITCATCHARRKDDGSLLPGPANQGLRYGVLTGDDWPLATVDVTPDEISNPVRPSDLRAFALQERLHHTGNLLNGRIARMVRIETLIASQLSYAARPDRRVVAALSLYLDSLSETLPEPERNEGGAQIFAAECATCHRGDAMAGPPVGVTVVGTDPAATVGSTRATGGYRSPSLRGVAERGFVLHDASAAGLLGLLQLVESPHQGHRYGLDLTLEERWELATYLGVTRY